MSAIWGCIDFSGEDIEDIIPELMSKCVTKYKIDRLEQLLDKSIYMACGIQYITAESRREKLPCVNDNTYFTADCIIDNRDELIRTLDMDDSSTDGELLFHAWLQWGANFGEHVIGLFSFALFDKVKNEFYLFTDHTSSRCIHYYIDGRKVYFATLTACITNAVKNIEINEKWMTACMSTNNPTMLLFPGITPFENIYILQYGCGVRITEKNGKLSLDNIRYWNPLRTVKQMKRFDDNECRNLFRKTFFRCVKDAIRTDGDVGILLSSGLDSSSIGCTAAKMLAKEKKKLNSYTSIALREFDTKSNNEDNYWVDDESEGVKSLCKHYGNINPTFLECRGKSVLTYIEEFCDYLEFPGKALINHVWMKEAYESAKRDGCSVILNGGYGNWTISYGDVLENAGLMACRGNIFGAVNQLVYFAEKKNLMKKKFIVHFFRRLLKKRDYKNFMEFDKEYFKAELIDKYQIEKVWARRLKREGIGRNTLSQRRNATVPGLFFQLMGMYETKDSLYNGVMVRDPSRDKRIIELCLKLPYKCYAWNGLDRRLVRSYLDDIVPDDIRLIEMTRGRQSGDAALRYDSYGLPGRRKPWDELVDELDKFFNVEPSKELLKAATDNNNVSIKTKIMACNYFLKIWGKD